LFRLSKEIEDERPVLADRRANGSSGAVFSNSHGRPRFDDRPVLSGIVFVHRNGLPWCDAPEDYSAHKTLYKWWKLWGEKAIFLQVMQGLAATSAEAKTVMIDPTYVKAHCTALSLRKKGGLGRPIGLTKGGMNTTLHAVSDANSCLLGLPMTASRVNDYPGAAALPDDSLKAQ
jgi:transposase